MLVGIMIPLLFRFYGAAVSAPDRLQDDSKWRPPVSIVLNLAQLQEIERTLKAGPIKLVVVLEKNVDQGVLCTFGAADKETIFDSSIFCVTPKGVLEKASTKSLRTFLPPKRDKH